MAGNPKRKLPTKFQSAQFDSKSAVEDPSLGPGMYVDAFGNKEQCRRCKEGSSYKHGHQKWCRRSIYFNKSQIELDHMQRKAKAAKELKANAKLPSKISTAVVKAFFEPKKKKSSAGELDRDQPPSPRKDSKRPQLIDNPFNSLDTPQVATTMEATVATTIDATVQPAIEATQEIVNPYEKPLLNWDPNGMKSYYGRNAEVSTHWLDNASSSLLHCGLHQWKQSQVER